MTWPSVGALARYVGAGRPGYLTPGKVYEIDEAPPAVTPGNFVIGLRQADDGKRSHWVGLQYFEPVEAGVADAKP